MFRRTSIQAATVIAGTALAALTTGGAQAAPLDQGRFHDVFTGDVYDCDGIPTQDSFDVSGSSLWNLHGPSPFGYYRESIRGTVVHTNLGTGRTFTMKFTTATRDQKITDNGDGTITIVDSSAGGARFYDGDGRLVLKDPGAVTTSVVIDYHGTPADASDDTEVPGTFQVLRPSTGHSDFSGRDFCADLATYTS